MADQLTLLRQESSGLPIQLLHFVPGVVPLFAVMTLGLVFQI